MKYDKQLLGKGDLSLSFGEIREGYNLKLTIDDDLQQYAYKRMGGQNGAVVALEPSTGKVLAMVSLPDFDPNTASLEKNWSYIVEREDSPLLARATQGLYAPGSTYKIVTTSAAYEDGKTHQTFNDNGVFQAGSLKVKNYGGSSYGTIDLKKGFEVSSNFVFCTLGYEMGAERVYNQAEKFGINQSFDFDFQTSKSRIDDKKLSNEDAALISIGQGSLLMTPLQVAMMGSAVANKGKIMKPYVVDSILTSSDIT